MHPPPLIQAVQKSALSWVSARTEGYQSSGLRGGTEWRQAALGIQQLRRWGKTKQAACLDMHTCSAAWTPQRSVDAGYTYPEEDRDKVLCSMCGACLDSVEHRTYNCEATQMELQRSFPESNHGSRASLAFLESARRDLVGPRSTFGLWLRGLLHTQMLPTLERATGHVRRVGDDMDSIYSAGEFYSDGTLGPHGKFPTSQLEVGGGS